MLTLMEVQKPSDRLCPTSIGTAAVQGNDNKRAAQPTSLQPQTASHAAPCPIILTPYGHTSAPHQTNTYTTYPDSSHTTNCWARLAALPSASFSQGLCCLYSFAPSSAPAAGGFAACPDLQSLSTGHRVLHQNSVQIPGHITIPPLLLLSVCCWSPAGAPALSSPSTALPPSLPLSLPLCLLWLSVVRYQLLQPPCNQTVFLSLSCSFWLSLC